MTTAGRRLVDEPDDIGAVRSRRWLRIIGSGSGLFTLAAFGMGFLTARLEKGEQAWSATAIGIGAAILVAALLCLWVLVRTLRTPSGEAPLTPKERLNRNLYIGSALLGLLFAMVMIVLEGGRRGDLLTNAPLPPATAALLVLLTGVAMPALTFYWLRYAVDELEAQVHLIAATWALYVFMIGGPVWWLAWRGGFAPEPDGPALWFAAAFTMGGVTLWKKFR